MPLSGGGGKWSAQRTMESDADGSSFAGTTEAAIRAWERVCKVNLQAARPFKYYFSNSSLMKHVLARCLAAAWQPFGSCFVAAWQLLARAGRAHSHLSTQF